MSNFTKEELIRYSRQLQLKTIGIANQEKIKRSKVLVVGAGGLGSPVLYYLAAAGIGTIGIIDFDKVELHNLQRQILFSTEDVGKNKAVLAASKIQRLNPHIQVKVFNEMLGENNAADIINDFDTVVDGSDNFMTRYLVNDTCVKLKKSLIYGTIFNFDAQVMVLNYNGSCNLRNIYPEPPAAEEVPNCDENGVLGVVPGTVGLFMANAALQVVMNTFEKTNTLFLFDLLKFEMKELKVKIS